MNNKLMTAAALLHRKIEREEIKDLMTVIANDFNTKYFRDREPSSLKIWSWSLNRWGNAFALEEHRIRELNNSVSRSKLC